MAASSAAAAGNEIVATRVFDAPREVVFDMYTDPAHLVRWWGPRGFTITIDKIDVRPGGVWELVMHGPDGRDYKNKFVYVEVSRPNRIVYDHVSGPLFHSTVDFVSIGNRTEVRVRMEFESAALRNRVAEEYGAVEGLTQTLERLGEALAVEPFTISRTFDAPRDVVWKAWTEQERFAKWFGPKGSTVISATNDLRPGGVCLYGLRLPNGDEIWGKWVYREIVPPERLVFIQTFSDPAGGVTRHPMVPVWPLEMLSAVTFAERDGRTTVTVEWTPINASQAERETFQSMRASMQGGWTGTFEQLEAYLRA